MVRLGTGLRARRNAGFGNAGWGTGLRISSAGHGWGTGLRSSSAGQTVESWGQELGDRSSQVRPSNHAGTRLEGQVFVFVAGQTIGSRKVDDRLVRRRYPGQTSALLRRCRSAAALAPSQGCCGDISGTFRERRLGGQVYEFQRSSDRRIAQSQRPTGEAPLPGQEPALRFHAL
jgi:hypothetical protein